MKVQMSSLNELENHVEENSSSQIKRHFFWTPCQQTKFALRMDALVLQFGPVKEKS